MLKFNKVKIIFIFIFILMSFLSQNISSYDYGLFVNDDSKPININKHIDIYKYIDKNKIDNSIDFYFENPLDYTYPYFDIENIYFKDNSLYFYFPYKNKSNALWPHCFQLDFKKKKFNTIKFFKSLSNKTYSLEDIEKIYNKEIKNKTKIDFIKLAKSTTKNQSIFIGLSYDPNIIVFLLVINITRKELSKECNLKSELSDRNVKAYYILVYHAPNKDKLLSLLKEDAYYADDGYHIIDGYNKYGANKEGDYKNGDHFSGTFKDGKKNGFGSFTLASGVSFIGNFTNDIMNGLFIEIDQDEKKKYGFYKDNKRDGYFIVMDKNNRELGREKWQNGKKVSESKNIGKINSKLGDWVFFGENISNNLANGSGNAVTKDRQYFIENGNFVNGVLKSGAILYPNGNIYKGDFYNDMLVNGKIIYYDGTIYEGRLKNQIPNGNGRIDFIDGTYYIGNFIDGVFNGDGKIVKSDGSSYEGPFKNGLPHGEGIYKDNELVEKCEYYEGKRIDQLYKMRIELEKQKQFMIEQEMSKLAEKERIKKDEEEIKRLEEEARKKYAKEQKEKEKRLMGMFLGAMTYSMSGAAGMNESEAFEMAKSMYKTVQEGGDGTALQSTADMILQEQIKKLKDDRVKSEKSSDFSDYGNTNKTSNEKTNIKSNNSNQQGKKTEYNDNSNINADANRACVITWQNEYGKWRGVGPIQIQSVAVENERKVFDYVAKKDDIARISHRIGRPDQQIGIYRIYWLGRNLEKGETDAAEYVEKKGVIIPQ